MKRITATLAALAVTAGLAIAVSPDADATPAAPAQIVIPTHPPLPRLCLIKVGKKHHKRWIQVRCLVHHDVPAFGAPTGTPIPRPPVYTE